MTDNLNLTSETALKTLYTNLYPSLSEEHLPTSDPTSPEETYIDFVNDPAVSEARHKFLTSLKASVELETSYQAEISKDSGTRFGESRVAQLQEERQAAHKRTTNNLNLYVYVVVKDKLESSENPLITPESIQEATKTLKSYIKSLNGKEESVHSLIQLLHTVHGKQREFTTELVTILQREALLQNAKLNKANNDLIKEKVKLEKKLKTSNEKLEDIRVNNEKLERLQKDYTLNIATLSNCEQQIGKLQSELKEARETTEQLQSTVESDSQVEVLREALDKETKLTTQLKTALESKQREIKAIEENSLEANGELEESVKTYQENLQSSKKQCEILQGEINLLKRELNSAEQLNVQITKTKDTTEDSLKTVTFQNKAHIAQLQIVTYEVNDLKRNKKSLEQKIESLHLMIKDLTEREKTYLETEELYEQNFRDIADKTYDTTQFLEELRNSSDLNKSLHQELNSKETQTTLDLQNIINLNNAQADLIAKLQKTNNSLLKNRRASIPIMGVGTGPGHGRRGNNDDEDDTGNTIGNQDQAADTTILDNVAKPIVKVLGELFSREDKKSIPTFKGKSTDKLITEWLKTAEHVARNNDWDEDQKIRFFSDRLKGEALEWHDNYIEEQGNILNYEDWRKDIVERFQDSSDLAALRKKLHTLNQRPEENCRAFVSRLNSLYDTIEGKVDK